MYSLHGESGIMSKWSTCTIFTVPRAWDMKAISLIPRHTQPRNEAGNSWITQFLKGQKGQPTYLSKLGILVMMPFSCEEKASCYIST